MFEDSNLRKRNKTTHLNLFEGHFKGERLVEVRIQRALFDTGLLFL